MKIKTELKNLTDTDIYSLVLFVLYKAKDLPEMSSLSQLSYILDLDNLLKLCEYYGGLTIRIPTIQELENVIHGLLVFQFVDIEKKSIEEAERELKKIGVKLEDVDETYIMLKGLLKEYNFVSGREQ